MLQHLYKRHSLTINTTNPNALTVLGETRTGKIVPWVVRSLRNRPPSLTDSKEDSDRGRDSTPILTSANPNHSAQIHNPTSNTVITPKSSSHESNNTLRHLKIPAEWHHSLWMRRRSSLDVKVSQMPSLAKSPAEQKGDPSLWRCWEIGSLPKGQTAHLGQLQR